MASMPYQYRGQDFSLLRDKGRFVLPSRFRKTIKDSSGGRPVLCLLHHNRWPCISGFGLSVADNFGELLDREEAQAERKGADYDRELRATQLNSVIEIPFDDSGRFVLPGYLAELGAIDDQIYFQGAGEMLQLWSPAELARMGPGWENPQAACRQLAAEAVARGGK